MAHLARAIRRRAPHKLAGAALVLAALAGASLASRQTAATHVDPTRPTTLVVGNPPGFAPMARVDGARRGRAHDALPARPKVLWRNASRGALDLAPIAVDVHGAVVVASAGLPQLMQLSIDGKEQWRAPTGVGPSIAGAVILSDETRAVATSAGDLVGFSPAGSTRFTTQLDLPERSARVNLLPLDDGGVAIAAGRDVDELDGDGHRRDRAHLGERIVGPLLATRTGITATAPSGNVHVVRAGFARRVGTLGGDPGEPGASTPDGRSLFAVVDHQRIVSLDLVTGALQVVFAVTDQSLHGPVVFGAGDALVLVSWTGVLLHIARPGGEVRRTPLDARADTLMTDAGKVDFAALEESPPPLTDAEGRIAFARVGGRIGVTAADGSVHFVGGTTCHSPAALAPAGPYKMVVACRDGTILLIGDAPP